MKIQLLIYKSKFTITDKEKEEYWYWHEFTTPAIIKKEDIEEIINKLKLQVEWTRKIAKKYNEGFLGCGKWQINVNTNEITIL